jgi:hypothetical protein
MKILLSLFSLCSLLASAQTDSEIYLADLKISKTGLAVANVKNMTNHVGYDNQPFFHPDKPIIYFSSFNAEERSDIKMFNFKTNETKNFTTTSEREYSPTVTPDKKFISCIIQRDSGAQDLGKYPIDGGAPIIIVNNLTVGYHAWLTPTKLVLYVLGDPNTLRVFDVTTAKDTVIRHRIGRSLHRIPGSKSISFVDTDADRWFIKQFDGKSTSIIREAIQAQEDMAWTPDGKIIMSDRQKLYYYDTKAKGKAQWEMFFDLGYKGITRVAVSGDGKKIAFVVEE